MSGHSATFATAVDQWRTIRDEWSDLIEALYVQAETATRGHMLNRRGKDVGIDPYTLFYGREARAYAYASDELIEWWQHHPRIPFQSYEAGSAARVDTASLCALCALYEAERR